MSDSYLNLIRKLASEKLAPEQQHGDGSAVYHGNPLCQT